MCHIAKPKLGERVDENENTLYFIEQWTDEDTGETINREESGEPYRLAELLSFSGALIQDAIDRNDGSNEFSGRPQSFSQIADWLESVL